MLSQLKPNLGQAALDWAACNVAKLRRGFFSEEALRKLFVAMLMACTKYSSENPSSQHAS